MRSPTQEKKTRGQAGLRSVTFPHNEEQGSLHASLTILHPPCMGLVLVWWAPRYSLVQVSPPPSFVLCVSCQISGTHAGPDIRCGSTRRQAGHIVAAGAAEEISQLVVGSADVTRRTLAGGAYGRLPAPGLDDSLDCQGEISSASPTCRTDAAETCQFAADAQARAPTHACGSQQPVQSWPGSWQETIRRRHNTRLFSR